MSQQQDDNVMRRYVKPPGDVMSYDPPRPVWPSVVRGWQPSTCDTIASGFGTKMVFACADSNFFKGNLSSLEMVHVEKPVCLVSLPSATSQL